MEKYTILQFSNFISKALRLAVIYFEANRLDHDMRHTNLVWPYFFDSLDNLSTKKQNSESIHKQGGHDQWPYTMTSPDARLTDGHLH